MSDLRESPNALNFSAWASLARDDPAEFDELRRRHIEQAIVTIRDRGNVNERTLRGLQWRIDVERLKSRTPFKSCLAVSSMMWDSFHQMKALLDKIDVASRRPRTPTWGAESVPSARVLPFARPPLPP